MSGSIARIAALWFAIAIALHGCIADNAGLRGQVRFDIGYGNSDMALELSQETEASVDMTVREGIFHFLSRKEAKILRLSSYGQPMAMLYDPSRGSFPLLLKNAVALAFQKPGPLAVDSRQTMYVADRQAGSGGWIIRRISSDGKELSFLGREGPGGTALPHVARLDIAANDGLAVTCLTAKEYLVWFYDRAGSYQYSLVLERDRLPVPESIMEAVNAESGKRIIPSIETLIPAFSGGKSAVVTKVDYIIVPKESASQMAVPPEAAGSWILRADPSTGVVEKAFRLPENAQDKGSGYQLLAVEKDNLVLMKWDDAGLAGTLYNFNFAGRVQGKSRFVSQDTHARLVSWAGGNDGFLYILASLPDTLRLYALRIPGWR